MAFGDGLRDMVKRYQDLQPEIDRAIPAHLRLTTEFIVNRAKQYTPPTDEEKYNANAIGELKAHWEQDSIVNPKRIGDNYMTVIANNMQYASYVENGHRLDKHFVPGLFIIGEQLVYDASMREAGGIMVGTKTHYVRGVYMLDRALREGESHLQQGMRQFIVDVQRALVGNVASLGKPLGGAFGDD